MNHQLQRAPHLVGSRDENPQVSAISRFHDDVWDFSNENQNPSTDKSMKRIRWAFATPDGTRFTDPRFHRLILAFKQFLYGLCWHPIDSTPFCASTLPNIFRHTKRFVDHLLEYPNPVLRFKDVLPHHCEDYINKLLSSHLSIGYKYHCLSALEKLSLYSRVMQDGIVIEPLKGEPAGSVVGWNLASLLETQTEIIPDEILRPLVQTSLEYMDRFASYLLDASEAVEDIRRRECDFEYWSARYLHKHSPCAYGLDGTKLEKGLPSVRELNKELCYLQTACFVLIAFATGMRVSEILSLRDWFGYAVVYSKCKEYPRGGKQSG